MFKYVFVFTIGVCCVFVCTLIRVVCVCFWCFLFRFGVFLCVFGEEVITFVRFSLMVSYFPLWGFVPVLVTNVLIEKGYCWRLLVKNKKYKYFFTIILLTPISLSL